MSKKAASAPTPDSARLLVEQLGPDPENRVVKDDEGLRSLADSIRVLGVLSPIHVYPVGADRFRIIDGERRWRAAQIAGADRVACAVWPNERAARGEGVLAGIVLNEHREAHGCLAVARRLRQVKNEQGVTLEQLAKQTALPLDRVKTYFSLLRGGSDELFRFFEEDSIPLKTAAEFVRYQKRTNEAMARALVKKYRESPMGWKTIASLSKGKKPAKGKATKSAIERLVESWRRNYRKEPERAVEALGAVARDCGFELVPRTAE